MEKNVLTLEKKIELEKRLSYLKTSRRREISEAIKVAKEFGDLSENAEYSAAKGEQEANEIEIGELEDLLQTAEVMDSSKILKNQVSIGTTVALEDCATGEVLEFGIVSTPECDVFANKISDRCPIGNAIIGHRTNDIVAVKAPEGDVRYKILKISRTKKQSVQP